MFIYIVLILYKMCMYEYHVICSTKIVIKYESNRQDSNSEPPSFLLTAAFKNKIIYKKIMLYSFRYLTGSVRYKQPIKGPKSLCLLLFLLIQAYQHSARVNLEIREIALFWRFLYRSQLLLLIGNDMFGCCLLPCSLTNNLLLGQLLPNIQ